MESYYLKGINLQSIKINKLQRSALTLYLQLTIIYEHFEICEKGRSHGKCSFHNKKRVFLRDMNITFQLIFQDIYHQILDIEDLIFPKFLGHLNTFDDDKLIF